MEDRQVGGKAQQPKRAGPYASSLPEPVQQDLVDGFGEQGRPSRTVPIASPSRVTGTMVGAGDGGSDACVPSGDMLMGPSRAMEPSPGHARGQAGRRPREGRTIHASAHERAVERDDTDRAFDARVSSPDSRTASASMPEGRAEGLRPGQGVHRMGTINILSMLME
ncbi:hypothetical protein [Streptomyces sp. NPDC048295]|uniref:hypothetical protein n=1 Tax=Streptomyces sp. NPDC048295 TaxID=3154617 RepID=UPI0034169B36